MCMNTHIYPRSKRREKNVCQDFAFGDRESSWELIGSFLCINRGNIHASIYPKELQESAALSICQQQVEKKVISFENL